MISKADNADAQRAVANIYNSYIAAAAIGAAWEVGLFEELRQHDAILLGAIGDPSVPPGILERGLLLRLRLILLLSLGLLLWLGDLVYVSLAHLELLKSAA